MSLKAKLEAVIYAAEEPVTLAQLAALFAADALDWKAEQQAAAAAAETASETDNPTPLLAEGLEYLGLEQTPAFYAVVPPEASTSDLERYDTGTAQAADSAEESSSVAEEGETSSPASEAAPAESPADAEGEAKRAARQRDREVKAILRQLSTNSSPLMPPMIAAWKSAKSPAAIAWPPSQNATMRCASSSRALSHP